MINLYLALQINFWWLFHTTIIFWKIVFPIHARSYEQSKTIKFMTIVIYTVGLVVSLIPIITIMADFAMDVKSNPAFRNMDITFVSGGLGFQILRFPPTLCSGRNPKVLYYSVLLPVNIIALIGITELIIIFYSVYKVIVQ